MSWKKITEQQNPNSAQIHKQSVGEILNIINNEDAGITDAVGKSIPQIETFIQDVVLCFQKGGRLLYVGSGTSGRLGVLDASEIPPTFSTQSEMVQGIIAGGHRALVKSVEGAEDSMTEGAVAIQQFGVMENDIILGITASGTTPFVLGALQEAKKMKAITGLLVCNKSPKLDYVDHSISVIVGPEIITGSTRMKAGTATKIVLNMISTTAMVKMNKTYGNLMVDLNVSNDKLWDRGIRIIQHLTALNYDDALNLLQSAEGEVKTALVMEKLKVSFSQAREKLQTEKGSLNDVLINS